MLLWQMLLLLFLLLLFRLQRFRLSSRVFVRRAFVFRFDDGFRLFPHRFRRGRHRRISADIRDHRRLPRWGFRRCSWTRVILEDFRRPGRVMRFRSQTARRHRGDVIRGFTIGGRRPRRRRFRTPSSSTSVRRLDRGVDDAAMNFRLSYQNGVSAGRRRVSMFGLVTQYDVVEQVA